MDRDLYGEKNRRRNRARFAKGFLPRCGKVEIIADNLGFYFSRNKMTRSAIKNNVDVRTS